MLSEAVGVSAVIASTAINKINWFWDNLWALAPGVFNGLQIKSVWKLSAVSLENVKRAVINAL